MSPDDPLLTVSWRTVLIGLAVVAAGVVVKAWRSGGREWLPVYFTYLVTVGFVPAAGAYEATKRLVNWRGARHRGVFGVPAPVILGGTPGVPEVLWGAAPDRPLG